MKRLIIILFIGNFIVQTIDAHPPWGIVVDKYKNIYFTDLSHNGMGSVWKLTNKGTLELLLKNFHAHNVNLDKNGDLITAHGEIPHTLVKIRQNGHIDTLYHTENYKEFFGGNCAWSPVSQKIIYGLREHKYLRELNKHGTQRDIGDYEFKWNQSIYVSPNGTIYATEIGLDNGCVVKIDTNGASSFIAKDLITNLDREKDIHNDILLGITEGCDGYIYVAEVAGKRIIKILEDGRHETFYKSENNWTPTAIDFFSGDAYILEFKEKSDEKGPRIVKIDESGNKTTLFNYDTYQKKALIPTTIKNSNRNWWIFIILVIVILSILFQIRKRTTTANNVYN